MRDRGAYSLTCFLWEIFWTLNSVNDVTDSSSLQVIKIKVNIIIKLFLIQGREQYQEIRFEAGRLSKWISVTAVEKNSSLLFWKWKYLQKYIPKFQLKKWSIRNHSRFNYWFSHEFYIKRNEGKQQEIVDLTKGSGP